MPIVEEGCDMEPQPWTYNGIQGYFTVPSGWKVMTNPNNITEWIAAPGLNPADYPNFPYPVYFANLAQDNQTMIFRDLIRAVVTHTLGTSARTTL
jgi:hypothetical protein